ncbi:hypothetical protein RJ640_005357 [Escallonia rubra]|uniref:NPF family transporter n=1 Tax=Escallonia rubra TaxID=112253 RepID=A0AA88U255_9ASTE|nr:hypothetical protein RJ640_005357 [Escallonia rubra]
MENANHSPSTEKHPLPVNTPTPRKAGGWRSVKYIIGNEACEKLASMSLVSNITVYLRTKYNLSGILLVNVVTIWSGTCNIASVAGALISDAYLGRYLTLLFGSIASLLGMATLALTAGMPKLRPPPCNEQVNCIQPQKWQMGVLYTGFGLLAIGAGGIRPCNIAFGADQFDTNTEKGKKQLDSFFNWWWLSFSLALLIALTGVVYIQTYVSWTLGYAIPVACFVLSITAFLMGRHVYVYKKPQGSVFVDMLKVMVAAFRKRKTTIELSHCHSFHDPAPSDPQASKLPRTNRLKCLDKAAILTAPSDMNVPGQKSSWILCTLQQVEQLKCLVGVVPVWISGIGGFVAIDQQGTFGVLQALQMEKSIGHHFKIPPAWLTIASMLALSIWVIVYESIYIPVVKKILGRDARIPIRERIRIGIVVSILCMILSGLVEKKRRESALSHGSFVSPISMAWLLPQFALSGLTEAFICIAIMEFLTAQMPESMRSIAGSLFFISLSLGSYVSSLILNVIHSLTGKNGTPWLGGHDLNQNRLEYYYYIIAALGALNFIYFTFFASNYIFCDKVESATDNVAKGEKKVEETELEMV